MSGKKPGIKVTSVMGVSVIEMQDGNSVVSLALKRKGLERLIMELEYVLEMAEDDPDEELHE